MHNPSSDDRTRRGASESEMNAPEDLTTNPKSREPAQSKGNQPSIEAGLLGRLLNDPLSNSYEKMNENGLSAKVPSPVSKAIILFLITVLSAGGVWAARYLVDQNQATLGNESGLRNQLTQRQAENQHLNQQLQTLTTKARELTKREYPELRLDVATEITAAAIPVSGEGILVTMHDGNTQKGSRVQDRDLQLLVNALWANGAEAITINGIRLGPKTALRSAGGNVLVNLEPVNSPYQVAAIGPYVQLQNGLTGGSVAKYLTDLSSTFGIATKIEQASDLSMNAAPQTGK